MEGHPASPEPCLKDRRHRPAHRVRTDTADIASRRLGYSLGGSAPLRDPRTRFPKQSETRQDVRLWSTSPPLASRRNDLDIGAHETGIAGGGRKPLSGRQPRHPEQAQPTQEPGVYSREPSPEGIFRPRAVTVRRVSRQPLETVHPDGPVWRAGPNMISCKRVGNLSTGRRIIMSHQQWEAIERTLAGLSAQDKRELVDRILQSLQAESPAPDRALRQRDALARLCQKLDAMPAATPSDGLTNRDHDRILYTR